MNTNVKIEHVTENAKIKKQVAKTCFSGSFACDLFGMQIAMSHLGNRKIDTRCLHVSLAPLYHRFSHLCWSIGCVSSVKEERRTVKERIDEQGKKF